MFDDGIIFAQAGDGYFYPGRIGEANESHVEVLFLDGNTATVQKEDIVSFEHAISTFALQANWKNGGTFYPGKIEGQNPMVMKYDDGDVENIELRQLRGASPDNPPASNRGCLSIIGSIFDTLDAIGFVIGVIVGIVVIILFVIGFFLGLFGG